MSSFVSHFNKHVHSYPVIDAIYQRLQQFRQPMTYLYPLYFSMLSSSDFVSIKKIFTGNLADLLNSMDPDHSLTEKSGVIDDQIDHLEQYILDLKIGKIVNDAFYCMPQVVVSYLMLWITDPTKKIYRHFIVSRYLLSTVPKIFGKIGVVDLSSEDMLDLIRLYAHSDDIPGGIGIPLGLIQKYVDVSDPSSHYSLQRPGALEFLAGLLYSLENENQGDYDTIRSYMKKWLSQKLSQDDVFYESFNTLFHDIVGYELILEIIGEINIEKNHKYWETSIYTDIVGNQCRYEEAKTAIYVSKSTGNCFSKFGKICPETLTDSSYHINITCREWELNC